jgi:acyl carrier protein
MEHVLGGSALMPAAGWIAMAVDALQRVPPAASGPSGAHGPGVLLEDMAFEQPHPLAHAAVLQTVLTREESGWRLAIQRRAPEGATWQRCVRVARADGWVAPPAPAEADGADEVDEADEAGAGGVDAVGDGGWTGVDTAELYAALRSAGLDHGPSFRGLHAVRHRGTVATGRLRLSAAGPGPGPAPLPVPWLDAALHLAAVLLGDELLGDALRQARRVPLPVAIARLHWDGRAPADGMAVHARLRERQALQALFDLQVQHDDGTPGLRIEGLRVQWAPVPAASAAAGAGPAALTSPGLPPPELPALDELLVLPPAEALAAVRQGLAGLLRQVLQLDAAQLPPPDSALFTGLRLSSLGVDSLAAMDLRDRVRRWLGAELPARDLVGATELGGVAAQLHEHLLLKRLSMPAGDASAAGLEVVVL